MCVAWARHMLCAGGADAVLIGPEVARDDVPEGSVLATVAAAIKSAGGEAKHTVFLGARRGGVRRRCWPRSGSSWTPRTSAWRLGCRATRMVSRPVRWSTGGREKVSLLALAMTWASLGLRSPDPSALLRRHISRVVS